MPKDTKRYRYFQIGIGWDSWTLGQLEADAQLHQMDDQPTKLIVLRLTEYYKLVERGIIIPGITAMIPPASMQAAPAITMNDHTNGTGRRGSGSAAVPLIQPDPEPASSSMVTESDAAEQNAADALDFFSMDEE